MATREPVELALFAKLQTLSSTFNTIGRKHIMPPTLGTEMQPAVFQQCIKNSVEPGPLGLPGKLKLEFLLFIYCTDTSGDEIPGTETSVLATTINSLIETIQTALAPDITGKQTLGGTVSHCWIEGSIDIDPGIFGKQGLAIVPVNILYVP